MATYKVSESSPLDFEPQAIFPDTAWLTVWTETTATYQHLDGSKTVVTGNGIAYDTQTGLPVAGTVASVQMFGADGQEWAHISGLTFSLLDLHNMWFHLNGDGRLANLELLRGDDTHLGSSHGEAFGDWGDGDDVFGAGGGSDYIAPGAGSDTIDGGDGNDKLSYANSFNDPQATRGAIVDMEAGRATDPWGYTDFFVSIEKVRGSMLADTLSGSSRADMFEGRGGNDFIDGRGGFDTVSYEKDAGQGGTGGISVNLTTGFALDSFSAHDTLVSIEAIAGTNQGDTIVGSADDNFLSGLGGSDWLVGNAGNDTLSGGDGNDTLNGGDGNDVLEGGAGADILTGGEGFDMAQYWSAPAPVVLDLANPANNVGDAAGDILSGIEHIGGSLYNDALYGDENWNGLAGGDGNDFLSGRGGDDYLTGGAGADTLDGGAGTDTYGTDTYQWSPTGIYVDLASGFAIDGYGNHETLTSIENVAGSDLADSISGDENANYLRGCGGDDRLYGAGRDDSLEGGAGNDDLQGGAGDDILDGGDGDDMLHNEIGVDTFLGGSGDDTFVVGENDAVAGEVFDGGEGTDALLIYGHNDFTTSTIFDIERLVFQPLDTPVVAVDLTGIQASSPWQIEGSSDGNFIHVRGNSADLSGWTFSNWQAGKDTIFISGGAGADALVGSSQNDRLEGGEGDDDLTGGAGNDTLDGGANGPFVDMAKYDTSTSDVYVDLAEGRAFDGLGSMDTLIGIEGVVGSSHNDTLLGDGGQNWFIGGHGNDTINGRDGNDIVFYEGAASGLDIDLNAGTAKAWNGSKIDTLISIEAAHGSQLADRIVLSNTSGHIYGRAGNDSLNGGAGNDFLSGGSGNDVIDGGGGTNTASYFDENGYEDAGPSDQGVTVDLSTGSATDNWGGTDTLSKIQNVEGSSYADLIRGNGQNNELNGGDGADTLEGYAGDDSLAGGAGNDVLKGGGGEDFFVGGAGNDILDGNPAEVSDPNDTDTADYSHEGGPHGVMVNFVGGWATDSFGNTDILIDIEEVRGTTGNDMFIGGAIANDSAEAFMGLAGNDTIIGGSGSDKVRYDHDVNFGGNSGVTVNLAAGTATDGFGDHDTLQGIETIDATRFSDRLTGDGNDNRFRGLAGNDTIDGGNGTDTVEYHREADKGAQSGVIVNLATGTATDGFGDADTLISIENVRGTAFNDILMGSNDANQLLGGGGNDLLCGDGGNDTLDGGDGAADIAVFSGDRSHYKVMKSGGGSLTVVDTRAGADGQDIVRDVEVFRFRDKDISFAELNADPTAPPVKAITITEDQASLPTVIGASDNDSDTLSYALKNGGQPAKGTVTFNPVNGTFTYSPAANVNGSDSFTIIVSDGKGGTAEQVVNVTISPVNDSPVTATRSNSSSGAEDTVITGRVPAGSDVDGDALSYELVAPVSGLTFNSDGTFSYVPAAHFNGTTSFQYRVVDASGLRSAAQTFTLTVTPVNDAPVVAATRVVATAEDTPLTGVAIGAGDVDGDGLSYTLKGGAGPQHGSVTFDQAQGTFSYSPGANYHGADSFTIVVLDGNGGTAEQAVSVAIAPVNDAPTGLWLSNGSVLENSPTGTVLGDLSGWDLDGDALSYALLDSAGGRFALQGGQLVVANGALLDYEQAASHSVVVRATDPGGLSIDQILTITLQDVLNETSAGTSGNDVVAGGAGADRLSGGAGNDALSAGAGKDVLNGGSGNDRLTGGAGQDTLTGGSGKDVFVFGNKDTGTSTKTADYITDFSGKGGDRIDLRGIDADVKKKGDQNFSFIGTNAFSKAGQVRYEKKGKETYVYLNTDSDTSAEAVIKLKGSIDLQKGWFVL